MVQAINSTTLLVSWNRPSRTDGSETGYKVAWLKKEDNSTRDVDGMSTSGSGLVPVDTLNFTLTNLTPNTTYSVQVVMVIGEDPFSEGTVAEAEGITDPKPYPPPLRLSFETARVNFTSSRLTAGWSPPEGTFNPPIKGYFVFVCPVEATTRPCLLRTTTADQFTAVFEGLNNFEDYTLEVSCYIERDGRQIEGDVAKVPFTTEAPPVPPVDNLRLIVVNPRLADASWSKPSGTGNFQLVYNITLGPVGKVTSHQVVNVTETKLDSILPWTNYTFGVSACLQRFTKIRCGETTTTDFVTPPSGE